MACRFSNVDEDCWEFWSVFFCSFSLLSHLGNVGIFLCYNQRLFKWEKWFYYINICINKTLLTETLCVLPSHALCVYFYSSALMWLKTTASQNLSVFKCWMCWLCLVFFVFLCFLLIKLWRFVKQPEEGSPVAHRVSRRWAGVHLHCCSFQPIREWVVPSD